MVSSGLLLKFCSGISLIFHIEILPEAFLGCHAILIGISSEVSSGAVNRDFSLEFHTGFLLEGFSGFIAEFLSSSVGGPFGISTIVLPEAVCEISQGFFP